MTNFLQYSNHYLKPPITTSHNMSAYYYCIVHRHCSHTSSWRKMYLIRNYWRICFLLLLKWIILIKKLMLSGIKGRDFVGNMDISLWGLRCIIVRIWWLHCIGICIKLFKITTILIKNKDPWKKGIKISIYSIMEHNNRHHLHPHHQNHKFNKNNHTKSPQIQTL